MSESSIAVNHQTKVGGVEGREEGKAHAQTERTSEEVQVATTGEEGGEF